MRSIKRSFLGLVLFTGLWLLINNLLDNRALNDWKHFQDLYPKLRKKDSVNAYIDYIDDGRRFGLRKGLGSAVKIDTIGYYVQVGRDLEHNRYFFQYISEGDWLYKAPDNDTVCLRKKEESYFFLLK